MNVSGHQVPRSTKAKNLIRVGTKGSVGMCCYSPQGLTWNRRWFNVTLLVTVCIRIRLVPPGLVAKLMYSWNQEVTVDCVTVTWLWSSIYTFKFNLRISSVTRQPGSPWPEAAKIGLGIRAVVGSNPASVLFSVFFFFLSFFTLCMILLLEV